MPDQIKPKAQQLMVIVEGFVGRQTAWIHDHPTTTFWLILGWLVLGFIFGKIA
jgi:hypothetical protein